MTTTPTYPGVYIEEVPSGVRTIVGVSTSVAAFVDRFGRGPMQTPVRMFSVADFERELGGLDAGSPGSYGIRQFFLNGGAEAYAVRVATANGAAARVVLTGQGGTTQIVRLVAGRRIGRRSFQDHGAWGNRLRVDVDYDTDDPAAHFNLTISEVDEEGGRMVVRRTEVHRNLTMEPGRRNNAIEVVNAASKLVQLDREGLADAIPDPWDPAFRPDPTGTLGEALPAPPAGEHDEDEEDDDEDEEDGDGGGEEGIVAQGAEISITVNPGGEAEALTATARFDFVGAPPPRTYPALRPFFERAIRTAGPNEPLLAGATVQLVGNRFRVLLGRTGAGFQPDATITFVPEDDDDPVAAALGMAGDGVRVGPQLISLEDGAEGAAPSDADLRGVRADKTGIYALEDADLFNILCIPAAAELDADDARAVYAEAETYCEERRAFLIIDVSEAERDVPSMEAWLDENAGLRHRNAAVYFPRVRVPDPLNRNRPRSVAASGTIAGLYATTDGTRGVWKAPAGTDARVRNVAALDYVLTDRENGVLNPLGVNAVRVFPVVGPVAWGARTLDGADVQASDWKYIPVRRLALFLEESLYRGTQWVVFEPNDEPLWAQIRLNIGAFMQNLFRRGAFQGQTPRDAYLVKCDHETTTQDDIDRGIVNILVGFAPLKPAEFVIIRIQQLAGRAEA